MLRYGALNRGGAPDFANSLTPTKQDIASIDVLHSRAFSIGTVELGAGFERIDDLASGQVENDTRFFIQWRSSY